MLVGIFGLIGALHPTKIGKQDLAALIPKRPIVVDQAQYRLIASPFGTIHAPTYHLPRPIGTAVPELPRLQLASLAVGASDAAGPFPLPENFDAEQTTTRSFPEVNRALKGDRLGTLQTTPAAPARNEGLQPEDKSAAVDSRFDGGTPDFSALTPDAVQEPQGGFIPGRLPIEINAADEVSPDLQESDTEAARRDTATPEFGGDAGQTQMARTYFGNKPMDGDSFGRLVPWAPGETPSLVAPDGDTVKLDPGEGETIAPKGEPPVSRLRSPAERLGLEGRKRVRAEKCLADAVYFEARGEPQRGQEAVAQVVMNRVFSGYYPDTVCGVVYQNAHRYLGCQFTFACDGIPDRITEPEAWEVAKKIARDTLDGKAWLPEIGWATHYHAYWVRPGWIREMHRLKKIGVHTFYRPRAWGDGSDAPRWGSAEASAEDNKL
jgi:hypothetical protein